MINSTFGFMFFFYYWFVSTILFQEPKSAQLDIFLPCLEYTFHSYFTFRIDQKTWSYALVHLHHQLTSFWRTFIPSDCHSFVCTLGNRHHSCFFSPYSRLHKAVVTLRERWNLEFLQPGEGRVEEMHSRCVNKGYSVPVKYVT